MSEIVGPVNIRCYCCDEWTDSRDAYKVGDVLVCFECRFEAVAARQRVLGNDGQEDAK